MSPRPPMQILDFAVYYGAIETPYPGSPSTATVEGWGFDTIIVNPVRTVNTGPDDTWATGQMQEVLGGSTSRDVLGYLSLATAQFPLDYLDGATGSEAWYGSQVGNTTYHYANYWEPGWRTIQRDQITNLVNAGATGLFLDETNIIDYPVYVGLSNSEKRQKTFEMLKLIADTAADAREISGNPDFRVVVNRESAYFQIADLLAGATQAETDIVTAYLDAIDAIIIESLFKANDGAGNNFDLNSQIAFAQGMADTYIQNGIPVVLIDDGQNLQTGYSLLEASAKFGFIPSLGQAGLNFGGFYPPLSGSGRNLATAGNDVLFGNPFRETIFGMDGNDHIHGGRGADHIDGGAGTNDSADYTASDTGVNVSLNGPAGQFGDAQGDTFTGIESLAGSAFADVLTGNALDNNLAGEAGDDTLVGGLGNDTLAGGAGGDVLNGGSSLHDVADYSGSVAAVTINITTNTASGGHATGDSLTQIEDLTGSAFGDTLIGNIGQNILRGGDGADTLGSSNNNDQIFGGNGNDLLLGGAGADIIDGGNDIDTVSFANAGARIVLTLNNGSGTATGSGQGAGDTITNVENITGSNFNDILTGDANANTIVGGAGNDTLNGGGGADIINGQGGLDIINGGDGDDILSGGPDADKFVYTIAALWNNDEIIGWQNNVDKIDLVGAGFDFADFTETQSGADTLLTLTADPTHSIRLVGINANTIDATDFV